MSFQVLLAGSGESFLALPGETLLAAAQRADIVLPHDCQAGGCGTCRLRLLQGRVSYDEQPFGLTEQEAAEGFALACQARAESDLVVEPARAGPDLPPSQAVMAEVMDQWPLARDVTALRLSLPSPLAWLPGQYCNILLPDGGRRSFSMASLAGRVVELHLRHIPGGQFTEALLPRLRPGDALSLEMPLGSFVFRPEDYRPLLLLATGTGIAPLKSMLESLCDDADCPPVSLYWGGRQPDDLYCAEEIRGWAGRLYEFRYVPVLSRADATWTGARGHVQQAVLSDHADVSEHAIYLCGSPAMIRDARAALLQAGASAAHLYAEAFTAQAA